MLTRILTWLGVGILIAVTAPIAVGILSWVFFNDQIIR